MKEIELERNKNSNKADDNPSNGLATYVNSLKNRKCNNKSAAKVAEHSRPCKQSPCNAAANAFPQPSPCANPSCRVENPEELKCTCTICLCDYHLCCTTLKKLPAKSTKWVCMVCKDFHTLLKTLQTSVSVLQNQVKQMSNDQKSMQVVQDSLRKENSDLREQVSILKQEICDIKKLKKCDLADDDASAVAASVAIEPEETLIIGDSMLRDFTNETFENATVQSISGAKAMDVFREVNCRTDLKSFRDVVIHCGTNDLSSKVPITDIVSTLEATVTFIQVESPTTRVHISAVCPRDSLHLSPDIQELNGELKDLSSRLDCGFIDAGVKMSFRDGSADTSQLIDGLHLNERGFATLSRAFADAIPGLTLNEHKWTTVVKKSRPLNRRNHTSFSHHKYSRSHSQQARSSLNQNSRSQNRDGESSRRSHGNRKGQHYSGCFNCGLSNHNQKTCHHRERVEGFNCYNHGHKARQCRHVNFA